MSLIVCPCKFASTNKDISKAEGIDNGIEEISGLVMLYLCTLLTKAGSLTFIASRLQKKEKR